ncbi:MAG: SurA N-terminal domain-containing protein [Thermodesulfobacteriota bacterium]
MLAQIRRNVRHPYIQVLLGLIILVFILFFGWGMESQKPTYVAKVNGDTIDYRSYQEAYNGLVSLYQEAFRGDLTGDRIRELGLGRRAVDQLVDRTLLTQEAGRRRLKVTESELQAAIAGVPVFQEGGAFRKETYLRVLDANRLSPLEYETAKRRELLLQKVEAAIRAEAAVSEADVEQEFRDRNTRITLEHVAVDPELLEAGIRPDPSQLEEFYGAEAESFRVPEKRAARYLLFRPEDYEASVPVTRQEAEDEYRWRAAEFAVAEAVRARHLLLQVEPGAGPEDEARIRDRAEALRREVLAGASFAQLAQRHSEDPGSKEQGGDLGFFERGLMVPAFEEAAFSLEPLSVSEPVRSPFGYHLIWVEERRPARQAPFEEVEETLTADIRRRKALEEAYAAADNLLMDLEDRKTTWDALRAAQPVRRTEALARDTLPADVGRPAEFVAALFALGPDRPGVLLETPAGTYLLAVESVEPSAVPPLDAVREQVAARFRKAEARRMAQARAKEFLAAAADKGWDAGVKSFGLAPQQTEAFARKGGAVPGLGWAPALKEAAFAVTEVGGLAAEPHEVNGKFYAFRVAARTEPDLAQLATDRERLRAELLPGKQEEYLQTYLDTLRSRAKIEINDALLF